MHWSFPKKAWLKLEIFYKKDNSTFIVKYLHSVDKVISSLRGIASSRTKTPDVNSSTCVFKKWLRNFFLISIFVFSEESFQLCYVITWNGPKAFVNPNLGTQIAFWSARLKEFREETLFKSLKSILKKKLTIKFQ